MTYKMLEKSILMVVSGVSTQIGMIFRVSRLGSQGERSDLLGNGESGSEMEMVREFASAFR
jgi:hypothetical protein